MLLELVPRTLPFAPIWHLELQPFLLHAGAVSLLQSIGQINAYATKYWLDRFFVAIATNAIACAVILVPWLWSLFLSCFNLYVLAIFACLVCFSFVYSYCFLVCFLLIFRLVVPRSSAKFLPKSSCSWRCSISSSSTTYCIYISYYILHLRCVSYIAYFIYITLA